MMLGCSDSVRRRCAIERCNAADGSLQNTANKRMVMSGATAWQHNQKMHLQDRRDTQVCSSEAHQAPLAHKCIIARFQSWHYFSGARSTVATLHPAIPGVRAVMSTHRQHA